MKNELFLKINSDCLSFIKTDKMADIEVSGECSSHISVKSKGNNDGLSVKGAENTKFN